MVISVKSKILMTVLSVVMMFALFILFYFPARQERLLLENYNNEIENFAKAVALGVKIAITEQNFEGVETAIDFVRNDERLQFVSLIQSDTVWAEANNKDYSIGKTVFKTFPDSVEVDTQTSSDEYHIIKSAAFSTPMMTGEIMLSFSTDDIVESKRQIRLASLFASLVVFIIGLLIGYWLARNISRPVLALRDAANKVGEGDLTQSVNNNSKDEVGELGVAFNKMVKDLSVKASLERVRSEIASMRGQEDLPQITPVIWKELISVGVPFNRCGVFIIDKKEAVIESYLSTPDGQTLGIFNLPFATHEIAGKLVSNWESGKIYYEHWNKEEFLEWMHTMLDLGHIESSRTYQGDIKPPESLNLHFVPFDQGMLYVGNDAQLGDDELGLVKALADAFAIAYARYEDFKSLEKAKNKTEKALEELKSTQTQLIQSEKMASLGELTAGIAHEIQNPLNFVNNFAEVSVDLIEELDEEMANDNAEDVEAIKEDLKQNLIKINHHGQRASSIVKGMLEHSRTDAGVKVLTDINALADEYLRLAYHGLRAKDKSFNADFAVDADDDLPKINVLAQDLGRVLLNLINNAFYAVAKKAREGIEGYKPNVIVSTKKLDKAIEIHLKDNGNGIPASHLEKIFQPFFTTKPTGEGTGLGLSLSYDIITKGHGGDLKVNTEEGVGTEFIIVLPE
jgi:signal transduction histidine kinase